ncbi:MAG: T9SS type A sorting domain-containing protein [Candidatus Eisenbacteria bacterium]|nr:T9SS type A sorting domain-containing protein [Candidatus Eisenbacteria bacterium]
MRRATIVSALLVLAVTHCASGAAPAPVSCQGFITCRPHGGSGSIEWNVSVADSPREPFHAVVLAVESDGSSHRIETEGEAFLVSALGYVVAVRRPDTNQLSGTITVMDLDGNALWERPVEGLASPALSPNGHALAYSRRGGTTVLDLRTLETVSYPPLFPFSVSDDGSLAGARFDGAGGDGPRLLWFEKGEPVLRKVLRELPRRIAFFGGDLLVLTDETLARIGRDGGRRDLLRASAGERLRDLAVGDDRILVGMRKVEGRLHSGELLTLRGDGEVLRVEPGMSREVPALRPDRRLPGGRTDELEPDRRRGRGIPWPLAPDAQHEVGNTYGEYQNYGGSPYLHPGVDVMGYGGEPVYAVAPGQVKAVLTTSGQWHWRVAIADSATTGTSTGYLYAHLDQSTIVHSVGDMVSEGEYIGDLVTWPVAGFHHCHFARIEDEGAQWYGDWMATDNPHTDFDAQSENEAPVFELAVGGDLLAFCTNQTSSYLDPAALAGQVDIIAHVGDTIESSWVCTVQEIRYTIYPAAYPEFPVVDDKLAVNFDMALDTYIGGPIDPFLVDLLYKQDSTCQTQGDYDYREFYHIITNSDGNEVYESSDLSEAWDTTLLPDADYVVRVTATDAAGNASVDSMTVTTANGNPTAVPDAHPAAASLARPFPNPAARSTRISYAPGAEGRVRLSVYNAAGRLVRTLADRHASAGRGTATWDLRDERGSAVASGLYLVRLNTAERTLTRKLIVAR